MPYDRTPGFSARGRRSLWEQAKRVGVLPLLLFGALYSVFGIVFLVVPGRVVQAVVGASRRLLRRRSR